MNDDFKKHTTTTTEAAGEATNPVFDQQQLADDANNSPWMLGAAQDSVPVSVEDGLPVADFSERDRADIALQGMIADAREKQDRVQQAKSEIQYPAIQRSIKQSQDRADSLLNELRATRQSLSQPAPELVQGKLQDSDWIASLLGILLNPGAAGQTLESLGQYRDKQNLVKHQNEMTAFNLNREQQQRLVELLQSQMGAEQSTARDLETFMAKTEVEDTQQAAQNKFVAEQNRLKDTGDDVQRAWTDFYKSDNEGEVRAAAARLRKLDSANAPADADVKLAVDSARGKREKQALDYYRETVGRVIDQYQGMVPDAVAEDLRGRVSAIGAQFNVSPELFGDIPTSAYWRRQLDERALQAKKDEWGQRLSFMKEKERNDVLNDQKEIELAKQRLAVAKQNADTGSARLALQRLRTVVTDSNKKLDSKRQTLVIDLKAKEAQVRSLRSDKSMLPFDRNKRVAEVQAAIAAVRARIDTVDQMMKAGMESVSTEDQEQQPQQSAAGRRLTGDPAIDNYSVGQPVPPGYYVDMERDPVLDRFVSVLKKKQTSNGGVVGGAKSGRTKSGVQYQYKPSGGGQ